MPRILLAGSGALIVVVALMSIVGACRGGGQDPEEEEQAQKEQIFATDPFGLESGLAIVTMTHKGDPEGDPEDDPEGEEDFAVNLLSATQEETTRTPEQIQFSRDESGGSDTEVAVALANETGPVKISRALNIPASGEHLFDVTAGAPWTIEVDQPRPSSAPETTNLMGEDNAVTPFFWLSSGSKTVTMVQEGWGNFAFSLLDKDGNPEGFSVLDKERGRADSGWPALSFALDVHEDGIYLFNVTSDGLWTIEIADGDQSAVQPEGTFSVPWELTIGALVPVALALPMMVFGLRSRTSE